MFFLNDVIGQTPKVGSPAILFKHCFIYSDSRGSLVCIKGERKGEESRANHAAQIMHGIPSPDPVYKLGTPGAWKKAL